MAEGIGGRGSGDVQRVAVRTLGEEAGRVTRGFRRGIVRVGGRRSDGHRRRGLLSRDVVRGAMFAGDLVLDVVQNVLRRRILMGNITGLNPKQVGLIVTDLLLQFFLRLLQSANALVEGGVGALRLAGNAGQSGDAKELRDVLFDTLMSGLIETLSFLQFALNLSQDGLFPPFGWIERLNILFRSNSARLDEEDEDEGTRERRFVDSRGRVDRAESVIQAVDASWTCWRAAEDREETRDEEP